MRDAVILMLLIGLLLALAGMAIGYVLVDGMTLRPSTFYVPDPRKP